MVEQIAEKVMKARQAGMSMSRLMEMTTSRAEAFDAIGGVDVPVTMIQDAYQRPAYSTDRYRDRAVREFANEYAALCYGAR